MGKTGGPCLNHSGARHLRPNKEGALSQNPVVGVAPGVAQAALSPLEFSSVLRTKLPRPLSDGLVGHDDAPLGEEVFDISEAQTESVVEPDGVADYFGREPVSVIARRFGIHPRSLPVSAST